MVCSDSSSQPIYEEMEFLHCKDHSQCFEIIPVYFWSGERVDLPCHMCELSMAYNGKVKYWAKAENMVEFLKEPQLNVMSRKELYSIVENDRTLEDPMLAYQELQKGRTRTSFNMVHIPGGRGKTLPVALPQPVLLQRDGKLSIIRANPSSQGVYFCYDELSMGITNMFYVLQAMTPPVSIFDERIPEEEAQLFDDYCSGSGSVQISPSINWRFHYQPTFRDQKPPHCTNEHLCATYKEMPMAETVVTGNETAASCTIDGCRARIRPIQMQNSEFDPGLDIELRWEEWTSCDGNVPVQRREAHCYLVAQPGFTLDEDSEDIADSINEFRWAVRLGQLVRSDAMKNLGIRLHSSTVAALLYRQNVMKGCGTVEEGIRRAADEVWRQHLLRPIGVREGSGKHIERDRDIHFTLRNPFQACFRYEKSGKSNEILIGTYMVETRDCF